RDRHWRWRPASPGPVRMAIAHVPIGQAVYQALAEYGLEFIGNGKRSLLIPQVAQVVRPCHCRIVKPHVCLFRAADPIETWRFMSDWASRPKRRTRFCNDPKQRAFVGIEPTASIEFDDDRKHVVVLQQVGSLFEHRRKPSKKEGIGAQARKHAKHSVRSRCPFFVIHNKIEFLAIREGAGAVLDRVRAAGSALKDTESTIEAILLVT